MFEGESSGVKMTKREAEFAVPAEKAFGWFGVPENMKQINEKVIL